MNTYKVWVSEMSAGYYLVEVENPEQAEDIYYGNELGKISAFHPFDGEYVVESVDEVVDE